MSEFRTLGGEPRSPTWNERARQEMLRERGLEDVYVEPEEAPQEFWNAVILATTRHLMAADSRLWDDWVEEMLYNGITLLRESGFEAYEQVVRVGREKSKYMGRGIPQSVTVSVRLTAIEHALDVAAQRGVYLENFTNALNERARYYRVGLRLEGQRFIPVTSEHVHEEVVRPTLVLLSDERFVEIDALYRKAPSSVSSLETHLAPSRRQRRPSKRCSVCRCPR